MLGERAKAFEAKLRRLVLMAIILLIYPKSSPTVHPRTMVQVACCKVPEAA